MCGFGFVLGRQSKFVLHVARNLPLFSNVLSGLTHVIAVEGIPKTIADHGVDVFHVAHFVAGAQVRHMGRESHVFLAASGNDGRIAQLDVLCRQSNRAQARATHLVDAPSRAFFRQARVDMRLTRWVLALACGQNLAENGFGNFLLGNAGTFYDCFKDRGTQVMSCGVGERTSERPDSGTGGGSDNYICHVISLKCIRRVGCGSAHFARVMQHCSMCLSDLPQCGKRCNVAGSITYGSWRVFY